RRFGKNAFVRHAEGRRGRNLLLFQKNRVKEKSPALLEAGLFFSGEAHFPNNSADRTNDDSLQTHRRQPNRTNEPFCKLIAAAKPNKQAFFTTTFRKRAKPNRQAFR
ncbi:MAG: hypothetical protein ACLSTV_12095, partial [Coriobacteriales bacterium]